MSHELFVCFVRMIYCRCIGGLSTRYPTVDSNDRLDIGNTSDSLKQKVTCYLPFVVDASQTVCGF